MSMIPSHYEINISLNGKHLFATDSRSIQNQAELEKVIPIFKEKFPESEGYKITATKVNCYGTPYII